MRFSEAVANLVGVEDVPIHAVVKTGPHPALKSSLEQILKPEDKTVAYVSTLKRQQDSRSSMLELAGTMFGLNATVDLCNIRTDPERQLAVAIITLNTTADNIEGGQSRYPNTILLSMAPFSLDSWPVMEGPMNGAAVL